ncbi:ABC transporter substrate-binding protein [Streptomyces sp. NPDC050560]|uniref:ABC transporter substrate-binding protein n=1 Tax=Streptomyces sp. NPDC050560 TaxID=3365630 RepID=UPI0037BA44D8
MAVPSRPPGDRRRRTTRGRAAAALAACLGLLAAGCGESTSRQPGAHGMPREVRVFTCCVSGTEIPVWLAYDKGLFAKYGLPASVLKLVPPPTGGAALISGSTDIGNDAPSDVINATAAGNHDLELVAGKTSKPVFRIMSKKLTDPRQIRGRRLGVSGKFAPPALAAYAYLHDRFGLEPDKDYTVVPAAQISDLVSTLAGGAVDAAVLSTPLNIAARKQGAHEVADLSGQVAEANSYVMTTKQFAKEYPAAVEAYLKAVIDAMALARSDRPATVASIRRHQQGLTEQAAETVYEDYADILDPNMYEDALRTYVDYPSTPDVGEVDVKPLMNDTFLRRLDRQGFLKDHGFALKTGDVQ